MASLEFQDGLREDHEHINTRGGTSVMAKIIMSKVHFPLTLPYAMLRLILDVRACNGNELNLTADIIHELFDPCVLFRSHEIAWAFYFFVYWRRAFFCRPHYQIKGHCGNHRPVGGFVRYIQFPIWGPRPRGRHHSRVCVCSIVL